MRLDTPLPLGLVGTGVALRTTTGLPRIMNASVSKGRGIGGGRSLMGRGARTPFYGNSKFAVGAADALGEGSSVGPWGLVIVAGIIIAVVAWNNREKIQDGFKELARFSTTFVGNEAAGGPATRPRIARRKDGKRDALLNPPTPVKVLNVPQGYTIDWNQSGRVSIGGSTWVSLNVDVGLSRVQDNPYNGEVVPYIYRDATAWDFLEFEGEVLARDGRVRVWSEPGSFNGPNTHFGIEYTAPNQVTTTRPMLREVGVRLPLAIAVSAVYVPQDPAAPSIPVPQRDPDVEFVGQTVKRTANNIATATASAEDIKPQPPSPTPAYFPKYAPAAVPDAEPTPAPGPGPTPTPQPTTTEPATTPLPVPVPVPTTTPTPVKAPQKTTGTDPAGLPLPVPLPAPQKTPVDQHLVDGDAFVPGNPRPDLKSISDEVGRIENKLAKMIPQLSKQEQVPVNLFDLLDLVGQLYSLLTDTDDSGTYSISSPCELDEYGNRVESVAEYLGGTRIQTVSNKIDALAQLLQVHKDLKQPVCKPGAVPNSNVTVTFTEVL